MNTNEYIESGILETYALGMLTPEEEAEVEDYALQYHEVRSALRELEETLMSLAEAHRTEPEPEWKETILKAAYAGSELAYADEEAGVRPLTASNQASGSTRSKTSPALSFLAIAASLILLVSLGINIMQYRTLQRIEENLESTQLRVAELETENQVMVASYKEVEQNLAVLRDPNTATFVMKGVEGRDPSYRANIYWNSTTETVYLDVKTLPDAPQGKQYQLWALKDGKPIDMGVFDALGRKESLLEMGSVPGADAFAVTLEKQGGAASPTLEEMYVYGTPLQS